MNEYATDVTLERTESSKMKRQSKHMILGSIIVLAVLALSILSACGANKKMILVDYRNISLYVDGELVVPKDAAGKVVRPSGIERAVGATLAAGGANARRKI